MIIRRSTDADLVAMLAIINDAASAYRGVIPADRWHEPYMSDEELAREIAAGVAFWLAEEDGRLLGLMGLQDRGDVTLVRHAYVAPAAQRGGVGTTLLRQVETLADKPILIGTWAAASWAIEFYRRNGFEVVPIDEKNRLLRTYWSIPPRQVETSVVLADRRWVTARGIEDRGVLAAMTRVPRHRFVPPSQREMAYADHPLPIGLEQTISQPYIVGYMTEAAKIAPQHRVLEIGTGSGYQAAILAELANEVYTIELLPELAERARSILRELAYRNVQVRTGDGYAGWREAAPFDAILVTAAPDHVPPALVEQLNVNGRMIIPVGTGEQEMRVITKTAAGLVEQRTMSVRFVPLVRSDASRR